MTIKERLKTVFTARKKVKITITLAKGEPKPAKFAKKKKEHRAVRLAQIGEYSVIPKGRARKIFLIELPTIDKIDIK